LSGRVLRIPHRAGDTVERDAVVAVLLPSVPVLQDDRTVQQLQERAAAAQAAVMRAAALEERAKAGREQAQADAARSARLAAEGFLSPSSREQSESTARMRDKELEAARFERIAAERELAQARAALARFRGDAKLGGAPVRTFDVLAPISGRVLRVLQESEGPVALGAGLLELGDIGKLEVVVDVLSTEAVGIPADADVYIDVGSGRAVVRGRVRRIEPSAFTKVSALGVEEQRVNVVIDLPAANDDIDALGDGYRVDARIVVHRAQDAVLVPSGALFRDGQDYAVFVVEGGIAKKRVLEVPRRNDRTALVLGGLQPGEKVIVFPGDMVRDGVRVAVR
jgi:HlyD family secretion protein